MDLNKLRDEAFEIAKAHGWHDEKLSDETYLMLIITEIAEAVQADRKGKHADAGLFNADVETLDMADDYDRDVWKRDFEIYIKNTVEDELADVVILSRIEENRFPLCGYIAFSRCKGSANSFSKTDVHGLRGNHISRLRPYRKAERTCCRYHSLLQQERHRHRVLHRTENEVQPTKGIQAWKQEILTTTRASFCLRPRACFLSAAHAAHGRGSGALHDMMRRQRVWITRTR